MALRRALSVVPYRSVNPSKYKLSSISSKNLDVSCKVKEMPRSDADFAFRPGMVPSARQIFYQYLDIDVPEISQIVADAPADAYSPELGWIRSGIDERVRSIITSHVDAFLVSTSAEGGGDADLSDLSDPEEHEYGDDRDSDDTEDDGDITCPEVS